MQANVGGIFLRRDDNAAVVVVHGEVGSGAHVTRRSIGFEPRRATVPSTRPVAVCAVPRSPGPALEDGEDITEERPDERQVGDEDGNCRFAEVPVHIDIGDQGRNKTVDFGEDGSDDDKNAHAKDDH